MRPFHPMVSLFCCAVVMAACDGAEVATPGLGTPSTGGGELTAADVSVTLFEDASAALDLKVVAADPSAPNAGDVTITIEKQPAHGKLDSSFTYTPDADFNGTDTVQYSGAIDGQKGNTATVTLTVTPVNDAPSFGAVAGETVDEDAFPVTVAGWAPALQAGPLDESTQVLTFLVSGNTNPSLFAVLPAVDGDGNLTFAPAADANGSATVTVSLQDDGGTEDGGINAAAARSFVITVNPVNDVPAFTKGADPAHFEGAGSVSLNGWATALSAGPADEAGQAHVFVVSNDNGALFSSAPTLSAAGDLSYTLAADANGVATVTVAVRDDGGTVGGGLNTSADQTFSISVTAVNDAPSFTNGADVFVLEDAGAQSISGWATQILTGPANESAQTVTFSVSTDNASLFLVAPALGNTGTLTFTTAANANGSATVTVRAWDSGGAADGGSPFSAAQTFGLSVMAVNDAPSFTVGANPTVEEDAGLQTLSNWATNLNTGPADESGQSTVFVISNNTNPSLFATAPTVNAAGTLSFTPADQAYGTATFSLTMKDSGGTANGGVNLSAAQAVTISVTPVNDATPGAPGLTLYPADYRPRDPIYVTVTTASTDSDGDTVTYSYQWMKNGVAQAFAGSTTLVTPQHFAGNETWTVVVTPNDGYGNGATAWAQVTLGEWFSMASQGATRYEHTVIWTGSEMIVWGGYTDDITNTGERYNPATDQWTATNTSGAPRRSNHGVVWTGAEMLAWGGYDQTYEYPMAGARYNPSTDAWADMTETNAPFGRVFHKMVWTGREVIVWGGLEGSVYPTTGGRYYPRSNTWATVSQVNVPTGRINDSAVWTGKEMIVWGGNQISAAPVNTGGRYDPVADTWTATDTAGGNAPAARTVHSAVWTGSEMIVWGGQESDGTKLNTGVRYDSATGANGTWSSMAADAAVTARQEHSVVWTGREMIVWGGFNSSHAPINSGGRYDPVSNSWSVTGLGTGVPSARVHNAAVWTGREMIVVGGDDNNGEFFTDGAIYVPPARTETWIETSLDSAPAGRTHHTAVWTGKEMIVWGGYSGVDLDTGGRYNPATDTWVATGTAGQAPDARARHTAVWTGREMIVWGGYVSSTNAYPNSGDRYDPATGDWTPVSEGANVPDGRYEHTAVWTGREMIVWGGADYSQFDVAIYLGTGSRYDPVSDSWAATSMGANSASGRTRHTAVWTGKEMIVWGGAGPTGNRNDGARYDPANDTWAAMSGGDGITRTRYQHSAVWTGREMIVWGGSHAGVNFYLNHGERYDPRTNTWTPTTQVGAPGGRYYAPAVWSGREMIVYGGTGSEGSNQAGGRYDPEFDSWITTAAAPESPSWLQRQRAVWTGNAMILWGGSGENTGVQYLPSVP